MSAITVLAAATEKEHSLLIPEVPDLVWGTIGFIVVLVVFIKVALPRLNTLLDARSAAIEGRIDEAKHAREEAEQVLERYQQQLAEARVEAGRIREQAREDGKRILAEQREAAQAEADRIVAQARSQIEAQREQAVASLRAEVGTLALDLASAVVGEHLADDTNATAYVDRFLADLQLEHAADGVRE
ncbi:F0F1 ATP synthase subunit B [uncultured Amnibacterium sp.]|uniref:F0F1 ATP synthase subunit B n=1 Tax=uncultured Amnibacterium sp. TaxID=1631851 RepID=UPI0035CCA0F7